MVAFKETNIWSVLSQPKSIFWLIRAAILFSFILLMLFDAGLDLRVWLLLATFLIYSALAVLLAKKGKITAEKLYFVTSLLDIWLITLVGGLTANKAGGGFFFLYFLVVPFASYVAGLIPGLILAVFSSIFYLSFNLKSLNRLSATHILWEFMALWALAVGVGIVVKEMKLSRSKLLRMFDILNQRTSELEKSQAQIETIYETSRSLGERLNLNEVVEEILNIVQKILGYHFFSIFILREKDILSLLGEIKEGEKINYTEPEEKRLTGLMRQIVGSGKPLRIFDVAKDSNIQPHPEGIRSFMAVPMISRGKVIGVMDASSTRIGAFLDQDEKIFSILAGSAALAVENALLHQKTQELTIVDELTGLFNFRYFNNKLRAEKRRAERYHLPLSLIMIDIDWFKRCNDTYGHLFGNRVLQALAQIIKESVRDVDVVCRYGGEEFAVILPQTKKADAQMIGERIRRRVESTNLTRDDTGSKVKITVSLGVASYPENGRTTKELIEKVDQALYLAKGKGKNLVCTIS